jgi:putative transposase
MPRYQRIVLAGCAHHVTQRGNHRQEVFSNDEDREVYLDLVVRNATQCHVSLLAYTLMTNHVHWIVSPPDEKSLSATFGRAHYRYSNYFQAKRRTTGHLWQNRFYSCPLSPDQLVQAMLYVELNPLRAGIVRSAEGYRWSSARAHTTGVDERGMLDLSQWSGTGTIAEWREMLNVAEHVGDWGELESCTFAGKPCGGEAFRRKVSAILGRDLALRRPGRPRKSVAATVANNANC